MISFIDKDTFHNGKLCKEDAAAVNDGDDEIGGKWDVDIKVSCSFMLVVLG